MRSLSLLVLAVLPFVAPSDASACGGCFAPSSTATVVTRHQMAVSLSPDATTLWDKIEYAGDPEDFVWVLPVMGGAPVELAENAFFEALEFETTIRMQGRFSRPRAFCGSSCGGSDAGAAPPVMMNDVTVHHRATVGPYETVTIGSTDPDALVDWLRANGYAVPDSILPTIAHYTGLGMDFAVLRLSPNTGINQMQPVRVTMPGLSTTFPLRMVAAGVGSEVGLELFVIGEGRYGTMNFPNEEVDRDDVAYDWATYGFTYDDLRAAAAARHDGRVWLTEFADTPRLVADYVSFDDEGVEHSAAADWAVASAGFTGPFITRLTADLAVEHLSEDLVLGADPGDRLPASIEVWREVNRPPPVSCPPPDPDFECPDPWWIDAGPEDGSGHLPLETDGGCNVQPGRRGSAAFLLIGIGLALGLRRRRS